jgi:hypothetical protein
MKLISVPVVAPFLNYLKVTLSSEVMMKILTLLLIIGLSLSVYAKTESGLTVEGYKLAKQNRVIANTAGGLDALSKLDEINKPKSAAKFESTSFGFTNSTGALTKPPSKKPRKPTSKPAQEVN